MGVVFVISVVAGLRGRAWGWNMDNIYVFERKLGPLALKTGYIIINNKLFYYNDNLLRESDFFRDSGKNFLKMTTLDEYFIKITIFDLSSTIRQAVLEKMEEIEHD